MPRLIERVVGNPLVNNIILKAGLYIDTARMMYKAYHRASSNTHRSTRLRR
jgi:hypothetical protein